MEEYELMLIMLDSIKDSENDKDIIYQFYGNVYEA